MTELGLARKMYDLVMGQIVLSSVCVLGRVFLAFLVRRRDGLLCFVRQEMG